MGVHWKIRFLGGGGEQENKYTGGELLKKGEAWTVCRFKWGLAKKRGESIEGESKLLHTMH